MNTPKVLLPGEGILRPDQITDLSFLIRNERCGILHDPGGGKTPPVCVYMWYLWHDLGEKSIWAQPVSLIEKNVDELIHFTNFKAEDIYILPPSGVFKDASLNMLGRCCFQGPQPIDGTQTRKMLIKLANKGFISNIHTQDVTDEGREALRSAVPPKAFRDAKVICCSFTGFATNWPMIFGFHPEMNAILGDEWHMGFAGQFSQRTTELYAAARKAKRIVAMTGTLIKGRMDSAYPLIHLIEPNYYFNHVDFQCQHGVFDADGKLTDWQNHEKLGQILLRHTVRRSFKEIFGDVPVVVQPQVISMGEEHRRLYDKFEEEAVLELEDSFLEGTSPGVATIRARQIMAHPETFGLKVGVTAKDELMDIWFDTHRQNRDPLVVFPVFIPEQERIFRMAQRHGLKMGFINGNVPGPKRGRVDREFRDGTLDGIVASADTAGIGFNWSHCHHCIFPSLNYKDDSYSQAFKRFIRGKRERPLLVTVMEYKNSIDQRIMQIVEKKSLNAHKVDATYDTIQFHAEDTKSAATAVVASRAKRVRAPGRLSLSDL